MRSSMRLIAGLVVAAMLAGEARAQSKGDTYDSDALNESKGDAPISATWSEGQTLPAEFGPIRTPAHIVEPPPGLGITGEGILIFPSPSGQDTRIVVLGTVDKSSVWALLVYFWPEFVFGLLFMGLLLVLWRLVRISRRPQVAGEPMCRKCRYQLTGVAAEACPECGTKLTPRNRLIGRSNRRRMVVPLSFAALMLAGGGILFCYWYPPLESDSTWWGAGSDLPRYGSVSRWLDWHSARLCQWETTNQFFPYVVDRHTYHQAWIVNLATGQFETCILDECQDSNTGVQGPSNLFGPEEPALVYDHGGVQVIETDSTAYRFDASKLRFIPLPKVKQQRETAEHAPLFAEWDTLRNAKPSIHGRYLFDMVPRPRMVAWDTRNWDHPILFPAEDLKEGESVVDLIPMADEASVIIQMEMQASGDALPEHRWIVCNLVTGESRPIARVPVPELTNLAFTSDGSLLVGEQHLAPASGTVLAAYYVWNPEKSDDPVTLTDPRVPEPGHWQGLLLAAVSRAPKELIFYAMAPEDQWYAWQLDRNELRKIDKPKDSDVAHWVRPDPERTIATFWCSSAGFKPDVIQVTRGFDDKQVDRFKTPMELQFPDISSGGRFVWAKVGQYNVVVFDRQTRRWLGRFDASPMVNAAAMFPAYLSVRLVDERWLIIRMDLASTRFLVFDLLQCVDDGAPAIEVPGWQ